MAQTLIFDFDGTLADSYLAVLDVFNHLAEDFGFKKIEASDLPNIRDKSIPELLAYLEVPKAKIPKLVKKARVMLTEKMDVIKPFEDLNDQLDILKRSGYELGVITTNSKDNVKRFFDHHKMKQFSFVEAGSKIFGKGHVLSKILKRRKLNRDNVLYVGDEVRDIAAAKSAGVASVAVTWGFNARPALEKADPSYIISEPGELLTIISQI